MPPRPGELPAPGLEPAQSRARQAPAPGQCASPAGCQVGTPPTSLPVLGKGRPSPTAWELGGTGDCTALLSGTVWEKQEHSRGHGPDPHSSLWLLCSFNVHTEQVDTHCGCCYPLGSYEKRLVLPCSDPDVQGQQLVLTLQMFSSCACSTRRCGD